MKTAEELIDEKYPDKTKPTGVSTQEMVELMESYAKEHAIDFAEHIVKVKLNDELGDFYGYNDIYNEWITNKPQS